MEKVGTCDLCGNRRQLTPVYLSYYAGNIYACRECRRLYPTEKEILEHFK